MKHMATQHNADVQNETHSTEEAAGEEKLGKSDISYCPHLCPKLGVVQHLLFDTHFCTPALPLCCQSKCCSLGESGGGWKHL